MPRRFNTAGPNKPERHYTLPPLERLPPDIGELVDEGFYFVLHAPRQCGKTTSMRALADHLRAQGKFSVVFASCEAGQPGHDPATAVGLVVDALAARARAQLSPAEQPPAEPADAIAKPLTRLANFLEAWAVACPKPLVLILDEIDALQDDGLISVLRQLRQGYPDRPERFPHSVCLFGMRDVRDYKVPSGGSPNLGTSSPFNIKRKSLTVRYFDRDEIAALFGQHTAETGQAFTPEAVDRVWELTRGQPWLVNALANQVVAEMRYEGTIDVARIDAAKEQVILDGPTHLDSLMARLREERVRRVVEPILAGEQAVLDTTDLEYCRDLGIIDRGKTPAIANPIYREVIPRWLDRNAQASILLQRERWSLPDGRLDIDAVRDAWLEFWREHAEPFVKAESYKEVAAQLVLMAFLQRIVNGGGLIDREYAARLGRMDIIIRWPIDGQLYGNRLENHLFELKVWREDRPDPKKAGLEQIERYAGAVPCASATLVVFDRRPKAIELKWRKRLKVERKRPDVAGVPVLVVRA